MTANFHTFGFSKGRANARVHASCRNRTWSDTHIEVCAVKRTITPSDAHAILLRMWRDPTGSTCMDDRSNINSKKDPTDFGPPDKLIGKRLEIRARYHWYHS